MIRYYCDRCGDEIQTSPVGGLMGPPGVFSEVDCFAGEFGVVVRAKEDLCLSCIVDIIQGRREIVRPAAPEARPRS